MTRIPFRKSTDITGAKEPKETLSGSAESKEARIKNIRIFVALLLPVFLETLDYTVVATAQSRIASDFDALSLQSWVGTSYLLTSAVFLPFFASIADVFGRHFGLQFSLLWFLVGSAISTGAQNMITMLVGRGVAGVGAAGLLTVVRTIMADSSSISANNWQQSGLFFLYAVGFSVGPVIGGYLIDVNFRWVFAINLPAAVVAMLSCAILLRGQVKKGKPLQQLPNSSKDRSTFIQKVLLLDWIGMLFFILGGILILLAFNWGPDDGWNTARVIVSLVVGVGLLSLFLFWEDRLRRIQLKSTSSTPTVFLAFRMLPLEIFRTFDMCVVQYCCFVSGIVMFVMFYFVAIFAVIVTGLPAAQAGIQLLYFAPGMGGGSWLTIAIIKRTKEPKFSIIPGSVLLPVSLGLIQMAMKQKNQGMVNGFMAMAGVGVGMTAGSLAVQGRFIEPDHIAIVSALMLFFRTLGGTVGLAQCFTVMDSKVKSYVFDQIQAGALSPSDLAALVSLYSSQGGGLSSLTSLDGLPSDVQTIIRDAYRYGVAWSFVSLIPWAGIAAPMSFFLTSIKKKDDPKETQGREEADHDEGRLGDDNTGSAERIEMTSRTHSAFH
ncbi:MFS general substrate transporter [Coniophora puteana RWD-64-598 SS2]|uniref:MFS general substrate transporter n=1 Tax=Coniophora puteana (strain RWD-64-598) TaxID=741705 RepID=R7SG46_CONPW|nr:MFS general substrate transporter [Coniophora puteana RWD-64-598 SS2]EIW74064.1 MFS general substrate transporter [Coniophora puteana RWD-64-598 SS2]